MSEPMWLRSAALSASLAGLDEREAVRGFDADDAAAIAARMQVLATVARSVGWTRTAVQERTAPLEDAAVDDTQRARLGGVVLAAWLRAITPTERNRWVRAFDAETLRLARNAAETQPGAAVSIEAKVLTGLVARSADALGRAPFAVELGALVHALHGDDRRLPPALAAVARTARVTGLGWREATRPFLGAREAST